MSVGQGLAREGGWPRPHSPREGGPRPPTQVLHPTGSGPDSAESCSHLRGSGTTEPGAVPPFEGRGPTPAPHSAGPPAVVPCQRVRGASPIFPDETIQLGSGRGEPHSQKRKVTKKTRDIRLRPPHMPVHTNVAQGPQTAKLHPRSSASICLPVLRPISKFLSPQNFWKSRCLGLYCCSQAEAAIQDPTIHLSTAPHYAKGFQPCLSEPYVGAACREGECPCL